MTLVIIESPYAGDIGRNLAYARRAMRDCLDRGETPMASHLLYTQPGILEDGDPEDRKRGIEAGYAWWPRFGRGLIAFYVDYGWSSGMEAALKRVAASTRKSDLVPSIWDLKNSMKFWEWLRMLEQCMAHKFEIRRIGENP